MYINKNEKRIKIKKFNELFVGDVFFNNEVAFIKIDSDYFQNAICLDDGIFCSIREWEEVEYQSSGSFKCRRK